MPEQKRDRDDGQRGRDNRVDEILGRDRGEGIGRGQPATCKEPAFRRLREKWSGERERLQRVAREPDAQHVAVAHGLAKDASPQRGRADPQVR